MSLQFNIGRDVSLDIIDPVQGPLRFSIKTGWSAEAQFDNLNSKALDGVPRFAAVPNGWRLRMDLDRADPRVDNYFTQREATYFNGGEVPNVTITETVREVGGGVSVYRYTGVSLTMGENGWRGNQNTTARVDGMAARRIKVA